LQPRSANGRPADLANGSESAERVRSAEVREEQVLMRIASRSLTLNGPSGPGAGPSLMRPSDATTGVTALGRDITAWRAASISTTRGTRGDPHPIRPTGVLGRFQRDPRAARRLAPGHVRLVRRRRGSRAEADRGAAAVLQRRSVRPRGRAGRAG